MAVKREIEIFPIMAKSGRKIRTSTVIIRRRTEIEI